jgi:hypothetical protein
MLDDYGDGLIEKIITWNGLVVGSGSLLSMYTFEHRLSYKGVKISI